ncbi:rhodanese-like domain-containing protein [Actinopolymorpha sp. B17G11]|uniref:rhodanese-like domain-containing protein n=1 Tax=Actinopolymorpha sp. B17G11 TaxID=3160861 RepID=UPI0032E49760
MTNANHHVDAATVRGWLDHADTVTVIDVRTPAEFDTAHIRGSYNVPLRLLDEHADQVHARLDHHVVLVCQSGLRAAEARQRLAANGMDDLHVLDGGVPAYAAAGGNVVYGRRRWSLDRQIRLTAGLLVLLGTLASLWVPWTLAVAVTVGAGLTYAGLTDSCLMGRMLSKLPYNQRSGEPTADTILAQLPAKKPA